VLIESPDHSKNLHHLPKEHVESIFWALRDRCIDLKKDSRFRYILIFKNWGEEAGASLEHSHMQVIATPIIPKRAIEELEGSKFHYKLKERCIYCDILKQEQKEGSRIIYRNDFFIALAPFASRFPFETWVLPLQHISAFEKTPTEWFPALADIMKTVLTRLDVTLDEPPFNFIIHSAPCKTPDLDYYHWHIEIMPKLTKVAGLNGAAVSTSIRHRLNMRPKRCETSTSAALMAGTPVMRMQRTWNGPRKNPSSACDDGDSAVLEGRRAGRCDGRASR